MDVIALLSKLGYSTVLSSYYDHIKTWKEWYKGKADFHSYDIYNGVKKVRCERQSLGMAKKVSEDKADLLLNEKVSIKLAKETAQKKIDSVLDDNNFWVRGNQLVEKSQALGTGALVEYLEGDEIKIDYIEADCIYPLTWSNGQITECAFASMFSDKDGEKIYVNIHTLEEGRYIVQNKLFNKDGKEIEHDLLPIWRTGSTTPVFQIITPNIANNINTTCPLGLSIFANSIDVLKGIDLVYDSYDNEFKLGKKRIFVDNSLLQINTSDGEVRAVFDANDTVFYGFPLNSERGSNKAIEQSDLTLRANEHELALQSRLNLLSSKCGFGQNYYQFEKTGVKTATEVVSENSQLYRNIKKDEIILDKALTDMVRAILFLAEMNPEEEISIAFDDSIIEDTEAIAKRAMIELNSGIIDKVIYYQRVYGYEKEAAIKLIKEIEERSPTPEESDFIPGGD